MIFRIASKLDIEQSYHKESANLSDKKNDFVDFSFRPDQNENVPADDSGIFESEELNIG